MVAHVLYVWCHNKQDCIILISVSEDSCARTEAVFVPRAGGKSHIKGTLSVLININMTLLPMRCVYM